MFSYLNRFLRTNKCLTFTFKPLHCNLFCFITKKHDFNFEDSKSVHNQKQIQIWQKIHQKLYLLRHDKQTHPNLKLQNLYNIIELPNPNFIEDPDKSKVIITCEICGESYQSSLKNLKQMRAEVSQLLIQHFFTIHHQLLRQKLKQKYFKQFPQQLSLKELENLIDKHCFEKFVLIDRQNQNYTSQIGNYVEITDKTFVLDVVSKQNQNLAYGKYVIANSKRRDAADTLIIVLVEKILSSHSFKRVGNSPKIILMTKDRFAETLKQIMLSEGVNIQIIKQTRIPSELFFIYSILLNKQNESQNQEK